MGMLLLCFWKFLYTTNTEPHATKKMAIMHQMQILTDNTLQFLFSEHQRAEEILFTVEFIKSS